MNQNHSSLSIFLYMVCAKNTAIPNDRCRRLNIEVVSQITLILFILKLCNGHAIVHLLNDEGRVISPCIDLFCCHMFRPVFRHDDGATIQIILSDIVAILFIINHHGLLIKACHIIPSHLVDLLSNLLLSLHFFDATCVTAATRIACSLYHSF